MSSKKIDADQRITQDLEKLTTDLSGLVTGMVKPSVDILWWALSSLPSLSSKLYWALFLGILLFEFLKVGLASFIVGGFFFVGGAPNASCFIFFSSYSWVLLLFTRFTWRMKLLTGRRGVAILYAYMLLGLGFLRAVTPEFGDLASREQQLEGTFR